MMMRRKILYGAAMILITLGLIFFGGSLPIAFLRSGILSILRPVFRVSHMLGRAIRDPAGQPEEGTLSRLQEENQRLRQIEQAYQMLLEKNTGLQRIVGLKEKQHVPLQGANVLFYGNEFGRAFLMLDEGTTKKIRQGNLAIDTRGALVGVVREAGERFAKVSIASNPGEAFEVVLAPFNIKTLAKGIGNRTFSLELISSETPVRSGDFALMPGRLGDADVYIGEVTRVTSSGVGAFQNVWAAMIARPETLNEVFIVLEE